MSIVVYPAVVAPAEGGGLSGRFPDLGGLSFAAAEAADLVRAAREALTGELQRLGTEGDPWPAPTPFQALQLPAGSSAMLVDVSVDDAPVRLTISLGERLLRRIDQDAEARSMTRSGYLALGARRLLGEGAGSGATAGTDGGPTLREEIAELGRRMSEALGPTSPVGRTLAELDAMALEGLRRLGEEVRAAVRPRAAAAAGGERGGPEDARR